MRTMTCAVALCAALMGLAGASGAQTTTTTTEISDADRARIDAAIKQNGWNFYGDPKGTMYTGGTPLFDESTGKTIDRYEYIWKKHPELARPTIIGAPVVPLPVTPVLPSPVYRVMPVVPVVPAQ